MASTHADRAKSDSWIEVSSQHSASSASSAAEEVFTHGLRVQADSEQKRTSPSHVASRENRGRRRGPASAAQLRLSLNRRSTSAEGSSQEEYEESESESDRVMTSSNEAAPAFIPSPLSRNHSSAPSEATGEEEDDEDDGAENTTALGVASNGDLHCFTPQPNAFSHPPSSQARAPEHGRGSYFSPPRSDLARPSSRRPSSNISRKGASHTPFNVTSSSSPQADHDAALRASLSTLLSCAAAARGLPKSTKTEQDSPKHSSHLPQDDPPPINPAIDIQPAGPTDARPPQPRRRPSTSSDRSIKTTASRSKRKAPRSSSRSNSKDRRAVKRLRSVRVDEVISPTLLTWVVSAGVLVLASALSFSAGYSFGREQGRLEAWGVGGADGVGECGRQAGKGMGLRRRLWSGVGRVVTA